MEQKNENASAVKLGKYKGLEVVRHVRPVAERTVQQEMVHQARTHAVYHDSAEPAKMGSRVLLDFEGFLDGEPIPDSKMEKVMVCLGDGALMPAAEAAVCGHRAGEVFRFDFTYPEDFRIEELSGKTAQFEINLRSVAEKSTPELNDEFAKSLGYESLNAMREAVRKQKAAVHEANADRAAEAELLEKAGQNIIAAVSPIAVDNLAHKEMQKLEQNLKRSGMTIEQHCKKNSTTPEKLRDEYRRKAETRIRSVLAAKAIAEQEGITVSKEEVNVEYHRLAQLHDTPEEEIRKVISEESIAAAIAAHKVQEFLLANAKVKTVMDKSSAAKE